MKTVSVIILSLLLSGCAGAGFNKRATLVPDEVSISVDSNPQDNYNVNEITGGLKWKLK